MTHEQIDRMPAGPKLDALACRGAGIASEKRKCVCNGPGYCYCGSWAFPPISTDPSEALAAARRILVLGLAVLDWVDGQSRFTILPFKDEAVCAMAELGQEPLAIARALAKLAARGGK